jgi:hypothetical protein
MSVRRFLQFAKLTASDGAQGDGFGEFNSVGISNHTIVVGAYMHFGQRGAVYVFQYREETGDVVETTILTPESADSGFWFGDSVAISGNVIVVGESLDDEFGLGSGAAYVFAVQENGTATQLAKLVASDPAANIRLGASVAIDQNTIVVGAVTNDPTVPHTGLVYVFFDTNDGLGSWSQVSKLNFDGNNTEAYFGHTVDVDGDRIVIGTIVGSAHVFRNMGNQNWSQVAKLTTNSSSASSQFGQSVSIAQNAIVVGAPYDDYGNALAVGSAIVFHDDDGSDNWTEIAKLTLSAESIQSYGLFGDSVALSEDASTIIVGATGLVGYTDNYPGAAYVFKKDSGAINTWSQVNRLAANDGIPDARFGSSVGIFNNIVVVSAPNDDDFGAYSGSAYMFDTEMQGTSPTAVPTTSPPDTVTSLPTSSTTTSPPTTLHSTLRPEMPTQTPSTQIDSLSPGTVPPTSPLDGRPVTTASPTSALVESSSSNDSSTTTIYISAFVVVGIIIIALAGLLIHYQKWKQKQRQQRSADEVVSNRSGTIEAEPVYSTPIPTYSGAATVMDAAVLLVEENATITAHRGLQHPNEQQRAEPPLPAGLSPTYKNQVESATVAFQKNKHPDGMQLPYYAAASNSSEQPPAEDGPFPRYKDQVRSCSAVMTRSSSVTANELSSGLVDHGDDEDGQT